MYFPDNYDFFSPVKVNSGLKSMSHIPVELASMGAKKPLVLVDSELEDAGLVEKVVDAFRDSNVTIGVYTGIPEKLFKDDLNELYKAYINNQCDSIIAAGGPEIANTAKILNVAVTFGLDKLSEYAGENAIKEIMTPMIAIPTSGCTGEETSKYAHFEDMFFSSQLLMPSLVVLDPAMMAYSLPQTTVNAAMIVFTHAIEAYVRLANKNPLTDAYAYTAIQLIKENVITVLQKPRDKKARLAMANASAMAGCAYSNSVSGMIDRLGRAVADSCNLPIGICMGVVLPYALGYYAADPSKFDIKELLLAVSDADTYTGIPEEERAEKSVSIIRELVSDINFSSNGKLPLALKETGVMKGLMKGIAEQALSSGELDVDFEGCMTILDHAWEGKSLV